MQSGQEIDFRGHNEIDLRNPPRIRSDGSAVTIKIEQCQSNNGIKMNKQEVDKTDTETLEKLQVSQENTFECKICDKRFTKHVYLKTHQKIHTAEESSKCGMCGKNFSKFHYLSG